MHDVFLITSVRLNLDFCETWGEARMLYLLYCDDLLMCSFSMHHSLTIPSNAPLLFCMFAPSSQAVLYVCGYADGHVVLLPLIINTFLAVFSKSTPIPMDFSETFALAAIAGGDCLIFRMFST